MGQSQAEEISISLKYRRVILFNSENRGILKDPSADCFLLSTSQYFVPPCNTLEFSRRWAERGVLWKDGTALSVAVNNVGAITTEHC